MRTLACIVMLITLVTADASAANRTFCSIDRNGTKTCHTVSVTSKTTRIMGMDAKKYVRGVRAGRCMPSPSGGCGGG